MYRSISSNSVDSLNPSERETDGERPWFQKRLLWGTCAGILWLFLFSGGILIDSLEYRIALGWTREPAVEPVSAKPMEGATEPAMTDLAHRSVLQNFPCAFIFFTPTNLALLALLAGFIGGCASNLSDRRLLRDDLDDAVQQKAGSDIRAIRRRMYYLDEHPVLSMMRSFIVYLILISGVYVISSDPFRAESQSQGLTQYMRLVGLVSLLGFAVGYDPTRFENWLRLVPTPGRDAPAPETKTSPTTITVRDTHEEKVEIPVSSETKPVPVVQPLPKRHLRKR